MSVDLGESLSNGARDVLSPRGVVVAGLLLVYGIADLFVQQTLSRHVQEAVFRAVAPPEMRDEMLAQVGEGLPFALDVALPVVLALALGMIFVNELLRLVGIRLFGSESDEPLPFDDVTRNFGDAAVKALVLGGAVALVITVVNFVPLLGQLVGAVLMLVFVYLRQVIALEDRGWGETFARSWDLFTDDPVPIAALLLILGTVSLVVTVPWPFVLEDETTASLVSTVLGVLLHTLGVAAVTDAFKQATATEEADARVAQAEPV